MTELQKLRARALAQLPLDQGSWDQRFAAQMAAHAEYRPNMRLTERQAFFIAKLAWRHRESMPKELVPAQDPDPQNNSWTLRGDDAEVRD